MKTEENMTIESNKQDFTISKRRTEEIILDRCYKLMMRKLTEEGALANLIDDYSKDGAHHA